MRKLLFTTFILIGLFLSACSGGGSGLTLKFDGQEKNFEPTSSFAYHTTKTFSFTSNGNTERTKASISRIYLANYELDTENAMITIGKQKLDKPEQLQVYFAFTGEKESSGDDPIKTGEYDPENERFQDLEGVRIHSVSDGKEKKTVFKLSSLKGKLVIESVTDEKITGNVDLTDGENSLKGSFTANAPKAKN